MLFYVCMFVAAAAAATLLPPHFHPLPAAAFFNWCRPADERFAPLKFICIQAIKFIAKMERIEHYQLFTVRSTRCICRGVCVCICACLCVHGTNRKYKCSILHARPKGSLSIRKSFSKLSIVGGGCEGRRARDVFYWRDLTIVPVAYRSLSGNG